MLKKIGIYRLLISLGIALISPPLWLLIPFPESITTYYPGTSHAGLFFFEGFAFTISALVHWVVFYGLISLFWFKVLRDSTPPQIGRNHPLQDEQTLKPTEGQQTPPISHNTLTIGMVVIIVIIIGGIFVLGSGGDNTSPTEVEQGQTESTEETEQFNKVPEFSLLDVDGNEVTPSDFPGKVLVINSWATWCPFCVNELPDFVELQAAFPDNIVVIAIDRAESKKTAVGYTDGLGVTDKLVWLLDPRDTFYKSIGGFSMPETLFVDTEGNIRVHKRGPMDLKEMTDKVTSIL